MVIPTMIATATGKGTVIGRETVTAVPWTGIVNSERETVREIENATAAMLSASKLNGTE